MRVAGTNDNSLQWDSYEMEYILDQEDKSQNK